MDTQANGIYHTLIASLVFVTALLVLFIISMLRHLKLRLAAYRQQVTREIELIDTERNRISADLHDELGSGLSAIGLLIRQAAEAVDSEQLQKAITHLESQQGKIREIARNLSPRVLETHGLETALNDLYEEIRSAGRLRLTVKSEFSAREWLPAKTVHLYRILRELLINIVKHADAGVIDLSFQTIDDDLVIKIRDNGLGFNGSPVRSSSGSGLQNIRSRAALLHASIAFCADPSGTTCTLVVPLRSLKNSYAKQTPDTRIDR